MKQLVAAVITLTLVVSGIVLATSLRSSAQEDGGVGDTTTTVPAEDDTSNEDGFRGFFDFRFGDAPELDELRECLTEQGIEIPEDVDRGFRFELRGTEGLSEALEACGLPGIGMFGGELPEGFPFGGELLEGFPFDGEFPEDFPFGDALPEGFPFELPEDFDFDGELPRGFIFGGPGDRFGFDFGFGHAPLDRDALASCLAELGSFENVDEVRAQLDECLPELPSHHDFGDFKGFGGHGFGGWFDFDFDFDEVPEGAADTST